MDVRAVFSLGNNVRKWEAPVLTIVGTGALDRQSRIEFDHLVAEKGEKRADYGLVILNALAGKPTRGFSILPGHDVGFKRRPPHQLILVQALVFLQNGADPVTLYVLTLLAKRRGLGVVCRPFGSPSPTHESERTHSPPVSLAGMNSEHAEIMRS